ncbi:hypothetical protein HDU86_002786 [Geranomyces michiganensis]|nr:hypothetical protein HDU86_002786 [Geranomyces michiganensis]
MAQTTTGRHVSHSINDADMPASNDHIAGLGGGGGDGFSGGGGRGDPMSVFPPLEAANAAAGEEKRTSLLDIVRDGLGRSGKTTMLYRVVVCGKHAAASTDRNELAAHYQKFFKQYQAEAELITGLLVVMERVWVHVLEASSKVTYAVLRDLHRSSLFTDVKVLLVQDDVPTRFFPFWASRNNDVPAEGGVTDADLDENVREGNVAAVCVGLCAIGTRLGGLSKTELKSALEELGSHFRDLLPRPAALERIAESSAVMGIAEWIAVFDSHVSTVLEAELSWPAQQTLVF